MNMAVKGAKDPREEHRRGLVGIYALAMMERSGPIHGYLVSERIAARTDGAWRPGPGAVYPSLQKLVERGLATRKRKGVRQEYAITVKGKALLAKIRARNSMVRQARLDITPLMAEVMGNENVGMFLLLRLRRSIDSLESYIARGPKGPGSDENLRKDAVNELAQSLERLRRDSQGVPRRAPVRSRR